jgi:L-lactate dehydrogenase complex protein LldF
MHLTAEKFDQNARTAIADPVLHGALRNLADNFVVRRRNAMASVEDWEGLRDRAKAIKDKTLLHLDKYLEQFVENAENAGANIHWARDGREACRIIIDLVKQNGANMVVKAKSMAGEEIHLNEALENSGIEPVETDLGEWIIQLAGETPSHIVVPAIHKTKQQIADLFVEKTGIEKTDNVDVLTKTTRRILRERFAEAEVGISGVNFGVAETGTILILENEGNIRLTTSLAKMHIAIMGIEKVIPQFADLDVFLKLLPRSGTGQKLTAYQSLITGTKTNASDAGPDEVHIVMLDNGRSRMLAHPVTRQSLACIRCGACLNACPVYQQVGGHAYGSVYPGPIGISKAKQLPYASSLCGACKEVCPVKIDIPELLLHLRAEITDGTAGGTREKFERRTRVIENIAFRMYSFAWATPARYKVGTQVARLMQKLITREGRIGKVGSFLAAIAPPLGAWTAWRDAPVVAKRSFRDEWKELEKR